MLLAKRLTRESNLKIIFPASSLKGGKGMTRYYNHGVSLLEKQFQLEGSRLVDKDFNGFAGTDEARAQEINETFRDAKIHGLIAGRGGYGCLRLLNLIDFEDGQTASESCDRFFGFDNSADRNVCQDRISEFLRPNVGDNGCRRSGCAGAVIMRATRPGAN